ncbi:uncharacterized protein PITG_22673 [Phytophthora infestans T30-4]|uniref:Uncharacterized protein n=1 Tax=Phytophthora infestans (strain T30-4) TaxID=403677 RepID=D0MSK7_PHYIT|nr:uncharacterized protein PITG_23079 [Phytophthora infestans T30-4]XP_002906129.1 uncharacterized protein PITG_22713 [Phytophthora infestans T30-4]XP_002909662.1 uncharacterized protein PITG_22673 [Phytophthora infestans T30-4]EEY58476.1 conserved hypothetical protein [Phytophthora infestans T30-4]EEY65420.1 conserved hypothetical protein [Phytophthora infestans T30-4]EEY65530.1 conserved hypothetical protein [Phytophthora infestans T30-4]|eukprot:XP_002897138.1 conserved hypothetical protein [Phytophthora infestans T30-4]
MKARIWQGSGDACVPVARRHLMRQRAASGALLCSTASGECWQRPGGRPSSLLPSLWTHATNTFGLEGDTTAKRGLTTYLEKWPS